MPWQVTVQERDGEKHKPCSDVHLTRASVYKIRLYLIKINEGSGKKFFLKKV